MKILAKKIWMMIIAATMGVVVFLGSFNGAAWADEGGGTSISISPVSKVLSLEAGHEYEDTFRVSNNSDGDMKFEVYAAPYSYTQAEGSSEYTLGFSHESTFTQIARWVTFLNEDGEWVEKMIITADPNSTVEVRYKITTPLSIPAGGQYAVLFAHVLTSETAAGGIKVEASPGVVIYGRAAGDVITEGEISDVEINETLERDGKVQNIINASARFSNTGNVDYMAKGTLKVTGLFGRVYYETDEMQGRISVIPESEMVLRESWDDTPFFGIFRVEWTVSAPAITDEVITLPAQTVIIFPAILIILAILLLTIIIVWIIIIIRKRRERRAKFMV